ncbi:MAG: hypothetical protein KC502_02375 [Myxococcales bacterium]|nr:hypothetical protein [Myxococcales bacterium]
MRRMVTAMVATARNPKPPPATDTLAFIASLDRWPLSQFAHSVGRRLLMDVFQCDAGELLPRDSAEKRLQLLADAPELEDLALNGTTLYDFVRVYMQSAGLPTRSRAVVMKLGLTAQIQLLSVAAPEHKARLAATALAERWTPAELEAKTELF